MAKRGPPKKFTALVKAQIVESLTLGLSLSDALLVAGFDHRSYRRERDADGEFAHRVKRAASEGKRRHLERVRNAEERWQASAWFLERKYGAEYGQKVRIDHGGSVQVVEQLVSGPTPESFNGEAAHENGDGAAPPGAGRVPGL